MASQDPNRKSQIGVFGLGVMGRNLAYNFAGKGFRVAVHDPWPKVVDGFDPRGLKGGAPLAVYQDLSDYLADLQRPRSIVLLVKAGEPTENACGNLGALLEPGDLVIDGGNAHFKDTGRRAEDFQNRGLEYVGAGISGGEVGALEGPSIMLGGTAEGMERVSPMLSRAAAQVKGEPCCARFGDHGAGHFVKMVHNGIEYAEMQMMAEAYALLGAVLGHTAADIAALFRVWNQGPLESYLLGISAAILEKIDPDSGHPLVEKVLDKAGQKGTGRWTAETGMELGIPVPSLAEAVMARGLSALKDERLLAAENLPGPEGHCVSDGDGFAGALENALLAARLVIFAQGFSLFRGARAAWGWPVPEEVVRPRSGEVDASFARASSKR